METVIANALRIQIISKRYTPVLKPQLANTRYPACRSVQINGNTIEKKRA